MQWRIRRRLRRILATYRNPLGFFKGRRNAKIDDLRLAVGSVLVERGEDNSVLIIAFTGGADKLMLPVYEFFDTTKSLGYSRILLRDPYGKRYHRGIDDQRPDFPSLVRYLGEEIRRLGPQTVICIGTSSGGYAAIRAGHALRADYVHAFSPQTGVSPAIPANARSNSRFLPGKPQGSATAKMPRLDLAQLLKGTHHKTTYYVHYCRSCIHDRGHAEQLFGLPGVVCIGYPCDTHLVAIFLAKNGFLTQALSIANQGRLAELARAHFSNGLEISEPQAEGRPASGGC